MLISFLQSRRKAYSAPILLVVPLLLSLAAALAAAEAPLPAEVPPKSMILGESKTLWEVFREGGWVMWPILAGSIVGLTFFFERWIELRRSKHAPAGFETELIRVIHTEGVPAGLALCERSQSSLARVLHAALLRHGSTRQEMELAVSEEGSLLLYDLRRNCRVIGIMSNIAPLLGLLGTVLGLIQAFDQVAAGGGLGKTEMLASGVAVALLTTAFGLIVAIPLYFMFHFCKGKADDLTRNIAERARDTIIALDRTAPCEEKQALGAAVLKEG